MWVRLLCLICLLATPQGIFAQQSGRTELEAVSEGCPVTTPYQSSLFVPPAPYPAEAGNGYFWFGTDRLWTHRPTNGILRGLPVDTTSAHPTFSEKLFWWRQGYDGRMEPRPKLTVTGKRLDSPAPALEVSRPTTAIMGDRSAMLVGVSFPTAGCWQITGNYANDELTLVVWVAQ